MKLLNALMLLLSLLGVPLPAASGQPLTVFAAASLKEVVDAAAKAYGAETGTDVRAVYAASSVLARQIEAGAPADLFLSANTAWVDYLEKRGLVDQASIARVAGNRLVVIVPRKDDHEIGPISPDELRKLLQGRIVAIAETDHVPAGIYARQALTALGIWADIASGAVRAANVRDALAYVARGEVDYGIVYRSDALAEPRVTAVLELPADLHDPINYTAAVIPGGNADRARKFLDYLGSAPGRAIFAEHGFGPGRMQP